jgi:hypothetical protein
MVRIRSRTSPETVGLSALPCLTLQVQNKREPLGSQAMTVSSLTMTSEDCQSRDFGQPPPKHTVHPGQLRPVLGGAPEHTI